MSTTTKPSKATRIAQAHLSGPLSEYCQSLLHRLGLLGGRTSNTLRTLAVTSCVAGEGTTTIVTHLAMTAAANQLRVLLVDGHFARPAVHQFFRVPLAPGLQNALRDPTHLREYIQPGPLEHLSLLTAGDTKDEMVRAFAAPELRQVFDELRGVFDLILIDCPPADCAAATTGFGTLADGTLLVVEAERVRWQSAQQTASTLVYAGVDVLGVVMNRRQSHVPNWLYDRL